MIKHINRASFFRVVTVILILFVLSACSSNSSDSSKNETISFKSLFENNPIDKAFENETVNFNGSTSQEASYARKLKIHWEKEVNNSYDILMELLGDEDKRTLEASQKAWNEYVQNVEALNNHIYYLPESKYTIVDYNANYMLDLAEAVKNRAFELMGWVYAFTGEVNFIFDKW